VKKRILNTAWILFSESGIDSISMRNIANDLGISATALYRHYQDKDELLTEMLIDSYEHFFSRLTQELKSSSAEERLIELTEAWREFSEDQTDMYRFMFMSEYGNLERNKSKRLKLSTRGLNNFMRDRIFEFMVSRSSTQMTPESVSFELISLIKGMIANNLNKIFINEEEDFEALFSQSIRRFLEGLK